MSDAPSPVPVPEPNDLSIAPTDPLEILKKWPDACRSERACEIEGVVYPAPDSLGTAEVLWWLDFVQLRVAAARSLLNNVLAAAIGAAFGAVVATVSLNVSSNPWAAAAAVPASFLLVWGLAWYFLRGAHHHALEQRWMLLRRRGRELGLTL